MFKKIFFFFALQIALFGQDFIGSDIKDLFKFSFHGKFCGLDTPKLNGKDAEEVHELEAITPIDSIDKACQEHDICYVVNAGDKDSCDAKLVAKVKHIKQNLEKRTCKLLVKSIVFYFETKNENFITELSDGNTVPKKITDSASAGVKNVVDMASFSGELAMNYGFTRPMDYIFDSKENDKRIKDFLQALPPRNEPCIESK